jgi:hypothetical protein
VIGQLCDELCICLYFMRNLGCSSAAIEIVMFINNFFTVITVINLLIPFLFFLLDVLTLSSTLKFV